MFLKDKVIKTLAFLTRKAPFKGLERLVRLFYSPDSRENDWIETVIPYDGDLKILISTKSFIEWEIFFKGYYEKRTVDFIKNALPRGGVFVDVGANIGCHSLIASKIARKVIAVEPSKSERERLLENVRLNNITNIVVEKVAVSDYNGIALFYPAQGSNRGLGSLSKRKDGREVIRVPVTTLDDLLKGEERIDFIKIDVEGHNKEVIFGAREIIKRHNPIVLYEIDNTDKMQIL